MNIQALQNLTDRMEPLFAAVFLYHAFVVRRMAKVESFVPYACIVPMSIAAAAYYFFWQCFWLTTDRFLLRVIVHLSWSSGALIVYFHIGALEAYFQPCSQWISRIRKLVAALLIPVTTSLVLLLTTGKMFFFSATPMSRPPLAFPEGVRDRIQNAFSGNAVITAAASMFILIELTCFSYFLYLLLKRRGDRWLRFGLVLTLLAILNDLIASMRLDVPSASFLFIAIFVEIVRLTALTEKVNRERMLRVQHSMRLAQIGEMTATVAHELVNPLSIIIGNTDIALKTESLDAMKMRRIMERIQESAGRMLAIVRGLRDHARQEEIENEPIDVTRALIETSEMMRPIHLREGITLRLELTSDILCISGNKGKLQQILLNLLQNASDATEGKLERKVRLLASLKDSRVQIQVIDNGSGIPQEHLSKIFTPFFTTKPRGKGTGIGLSFVDSQVRLMNGQVFVQSQAGETAFTLSFPATPV